MEEVEQGAGDRILNIPSNHNSLAHNSTVALIVATGVLAITACTGVGGNTSTITPGTTPSASEGINLLSGQWNYMPGSTVTSAGLHIGYRDTRIVEQDGSGGQPNPAVNEYGTHVQIAGGFAVKTVLKSMRGPATISFDARPPIVSDEFRVNPAGIDLTLKPGMVSVKVWDGKSTDDLAAQQPIDSRDFRAPTSSSEQLEVKDQNGQITVGVNGREIGKVSDHNVFSTGAVWFGFNAGDETQSGSFDISQLSIKPLGNGKVTAINTAAEAPTRKHQSGLQELANKKRPGFLIGGNDALWANVSDPEFRRFMFGGNFGIITPENAMKWQFIEPQPGIYDFHESDAIVNEVLKDGMQVHGHNLVFSEALPDWVRNLPTDTPEQRVYVRQVMVDHITQLVTHFKGRVHEWDVVNEPFKDYNDNGSFDSAQPLRENVFYRAMGADYIKIAVEAAYKADPSLKLIINDYGNENDDGARWDATSNFLINLQNELRPQGIKIMFGFESHIYHPATDDISNDTAANGKTILENNINTLGGHGILSRVSEIDAPQSSPDWSKDNSSQAAQLGDTLRICLGNQYCTAFSMWSLGPLDVYQSDQHTLQTGSIDSILGPNDRIVQPAYAGLQSVLR